MRKEVTQVLSIIEPALEDQSIRPVDSMLYISSDTLDELEWWEDRLTRLGRDYMIAEFKSGKETRFGIFIRPELLDN